MHTERVTFLTTPDHKAALDSFAMNAGMSTAHVVREATSRYIADGAKEDEETLAALVREVEIAIPQMRADIRDMIAAIEASNRAVDAALNDVSAR